jgi:hypothetical protein
MELKLSHYTSQKPSRNIRFADLAFLTSFLAPVHVVNGGALRAPETTPPGRPLTGPISSGRPDGRPEVWEGRHGPDNGLRARSLARCPGGSEGLASCQA